MNQKSPIPERVDLAWMMQNWKTVEEALRWSHQSKNALYIASDGKRRRMKAAPGALNAILDLRAKTNVNVSELSRRDCSAPVSETDGPTQWHPHILTTTVWTWDPPSATVSWAISHVSTYSTIGLFSVVKNGETVIQYQGNAPGEPYSLTQNGSETAAVGDVFLHSAGYHQFTVPPCSESQSFPDPEQEPEQDPSATDCQQCIDSILVDDVTLLPLVDDVTKNVLTNT